MSYDLDEISQHSNSGLEKWKKGNKKKNHLALLDDMGYDKPTYGAVKLQPLHANAIVPYGESGMV